MATYVNNLRLKEITTGDESGTWGTSTNTNLELIGEALGYGTEALTTNADTQTITMADGASDGMRALYLKITGALDSTCTITLAPNDIDKVWIIENATSDSGSSGPYSIIISQGSGSNVTIGNSKVSVLYTDGGAGSAAVVDALADLELSSTLTVAGASTLTGAVTMSGDASVGDDLTLVSDAAVLNFGVNSDVSLTHVHDTGLLLNSTRQLQFNDSSQYISGTSATVLSIAATDEIDLTATAVDLNGTLDVSGTSTVNGIFSVKNRTDLYASTGPTLAAQLGGGSDIGLNTSTGNADFNIKCAGEFAVSIDGSGTTMFNLDGTTTTIIGDALVSDDLTLNSDASVLGFGLNTDVTLTHVHDTGLLLNSTRQLQFNDSSQYISGTSATVLSINATDEIDLNATTVTASGDLIIGTNPASSGDIRLHKNFGILARNQENDGDMYAITSGHVTGNEGSAPALASLEIGSNSANTWAAIRFHCSVINVMVLTSTLIALNKAVTMNNATIKMTALPTSDPSVAGRLWNSSGDVRISAG